MSVSFLFQQPFVCFIFQRNQLYISWTQNNKPIKFPVLWIVQSDKTETWNYFIFILVTKLGSAQDRSKCEQSISIQMLTIPSKSLHSGFVQKNEFKFQIWLLPIWSLNRENNCPKNIYKVASVFMNWYEMTKYLPVTLTGKSTSL